MRNERLRALLLERGQTLDKLAEAVHVDPKTVERWITTGRTPYRRHRFDVVAGAGAIGGVVNALLSSNGFAPPQFSNGILQLGITGNVLLGAFAAIITWGLYGPLKDAVLLGTQPASQLPANLTVTAVVGAALAGAGGARVVSNEIDKKFFKSAATVAAQKAASPALAAAIATASPADALENAKQAT